MEAVPEPGTELYIKFMQQIEDSYKMLAAAFPDVTQFEVGNELNAPKGHNLCKDGLEMGQQQKKMRLLYSLLVSRHW